MKKTLEHPLYTQALMLEYSLEMRMFSVQDLFVLRYDDSVKTYGI